MAKGRAILVKLLSKLRDSRNISARRFWMLNEDKHSVHTTDVPKGHCAVYVGEHLCRFIIPTSYLHHSLFSHLLQKSADEFGFDHRLGIVIPCDETSFQNLTSFLEKSTDMKRRSKNEAARNIFCLKSIVV